MLLILFWLGWVGMLAGAIVIIVQAPRCKPIPEMNWWNEGPLYQISDAKSFSDGIKGESNRISWCLIQKEEKKSQGILRFQGQALRFVSPSALLITDC